VVERCAAMAPIKQHGVSSGRGRPRRGEHRRVLLETAVLAVLLDRERHGYGLIEEIGVLVKGQVCVDPGSVYRLLRIMEQDGLVASSWHPPDAGPNRRVYVITHLGRDLLAERIRFLRQRASILLALADEVECRLAGEEGEESGERKPLTD